MIVDPIQSSTLVYMTIHLDYGLKGTVGYTPDRTTCDAKDALGMVVLIPNNRWYAFSVSGPISDTQSIQNENVFKRDPGFGGLVRDNITNPVKGVRVQIYGPDGKLIATVYTDADGWYMYSYKCTGKATRFTVKLPDYKLQQSVTLKANSFVVVNFTI